MNFVQPEPHNIAIKSSGELDGFCKAYQADIPYHLQYVLPALLNTPAPAPVPVPAPGPVNPYPDCGVRCV